VSGPRATAALPRVCCSQATVIRNGQRDEVDAKDVVPGDIVLVKVGDKVPADCRIIRLETSACCAEVLCCW
jgi:P-type E1-E2 ATPase